MRDWRVDDLERRVKALEARPVSQGDGFGCGLMILALLALLDAIFNGGGVAHALLRPWMEGR